MLEPDGTPIKMEEDGSTDWKVSKGPYKNKDGAIFVEFEYLKT